jgi:hypothetical protein
MNRWNVSGPNCFHDCETTLSEIKTKFVFTRESNIASPGLSMDEIFAAGAQGGLALSRRRLEASQSSLSILRSSRKRSGSMRTSMIL